MTGELPCRGLGHFFLSSLPQDLRQARELCRQCPAREPCLDRGIKQKEKWGMYGGVLIYRRKIPRTYTERIPGAPPKVSPPKGIIALDPVLLPEKYHDLVVGEPPLGFGRGLF